MRDSEEEVMAMAKADITMSEDIAKEEKAEHAKLLITVFERIFKGFEESIYTAAIDCRNNDASAALYEVHGAVCAMDIPFEVREAMSVPHPKE